MSQLPGMGPGGVAPPGFADYLEVMNACWQQDPRARPGFVTVISTLRSILETTMTQRQARAG